MRARCQIDVQHLEYYKSAYWTALGDSSIVCGTLESGYGESFRKLDSRVLEVWGLQCSIEADVQ